MNTSQNGKGARASLKTRKVELTRVQVDNLWIGLQILAQTRITTRMRFAISRCRQCLEPTVKAFAEALPEPDITAFRQDLTQLPGHLTQDDRAKAVKELEALHEEALRLHREWNEERGKHLQDKVEVEVHDVPLECEIDDDVSVPMPGVDRNMRNQALVEALAPVWVEVECP